jgi:hypothetical protein
MFPSTPLDFQAMEGEAAPMSYVYRQRGFEGDVRDLRAQQSVEAARQLQDRVKSTVDFDAYGTKRMQLAGEIAQMEGVLANRASLSADQYERISRALNEARDRMRELVDGPALKATAQYLSEWAAHAERVAAADDQMVYTVGENGRQVAHTREEYALMERQVVDTAAAYAKALYGFQHGLAGEEENLATRIQSPEDIQRVQDARRKVEEQFKATSANVQSTLTHALVTGFMDGGQSGSEALKRAMKATFATLVLEPIIRPIMMPFANLAASASMSVFGPMMGTLGGGAAMWGAGGAAGAGASAASLDAAAGFGVGGAAAGGAAAGFSWMPPIAAGLGLAYAYNSGVANQSMPIFGKVGNAIDSIFPGVGSALGMGGGRGPKNPQMGLMRTGDGTFFIGQNNSGGADFGQSQLVPLIAQLNDRTKYDQRMLEQMTGYVTGSVGTSPDQMLAMVMQRLAGAALPDLGGLQNQRTQLAAQLRGTIGVDSLQSFRDALKTSDLGGGGPLDHLGSARDIFERELAAVKGGDFGHLGTLQSSAQQYLQLGRGAYASGQGFQDISAEVSRALDEVGDKQQEVLDKVGFAIKQGAVDTVSAIKKQTDDIVNALQAVQTSIEKVESAIALG